TREKVRDRLATEQDAGFRPARAQQIARAGAATPDELGDAQHDSGQGPPPGSHRPSTSTARLDPHNEPAQPARSGGTPCAPPDGWAAGSPPTRATASNDMPKGGWKRRSTRRTNVSRSLRRACIPGTVRRRSRQLLRYQP